MGGIGGVWQFHDKCYKDVKIMKNRDGKKMLQDDSSLFLSMDALIDGDHLWLLSCEPDILLNFDFNSMKLRDYYIVPGEDVVQYAHLELENIGDVIYIVPYMKEGLYYLDRETNALKEIRIPYAEGETEKNCKFAFSTTWQSYLVLVGHAIQGIFYYDEKNNTFTRETGYLRELKKAGCDISKPLFGGWRYQSGEELLIPVYDSNFILQMNLERREYKIFELSAGKEIRLCTIDAFEETGKRKYFLTTTNDEMLIWSPETGVEKMKELEMLGGDGTKRYLQALCANGKRYYLPSNERRIFVEDDDKIKELPYEYETRGSFAEVREPQFGAIVRFEDNIFFQARSNGQIFKIDTKEDKICRIDFDVMAEKKDEIISKLHHHRKRINCLKESSFYRLDNYIKMII